jgi:hypothetical protein
MNKGRLTPEKFGDIMSAIFQHFNNKKLSKERKNISDKNDSKVSSVMIFLANCPTKNNLLHSKFLKIR